MATQSSPLQSPAKQAPNVNPFARALADMEREKQYSGGVAPGDDPNNLFRDALAKAGGQFPNYSDFANDPTDPNSVFDQQRYLQEQQERQKKEALRKKLHDQVNPVDTHDLFNAREQQVKQEIDQLRQELKLLFREVQDFQQEVEMTLMSEVVEPGQSGIYYFNFFHNLRSFIMMLRQKISSAKTWATQMHVKSKKKKARQGMVIGGLGHEKTSTIQDMMHHERSSQYSGG